MFTSGYVNTSASLGEREMCGNTSPKVELLSICGFSFVVELLNRVLWPTQSGVDQDVEMTSHTLFGHDVPFISINLAKKAALVYYQICTTFSGTKIVKKTKKFLWICRVSILDACYRAKIAVWNDEYAILLVIKKHLILGGKNSLCFWTRACQPK
jgi:hypothetical protein